MHTVHNDSASPKQLKIKFYFPFPHRQLAQSLFRECFSDVSAIVPASSISLCLLRLDLVTPDKGRWDADLNKKESEKYFLPKGLKKQKHFPCF